MSSNTPHKPRVALGMSGGVDSSLSAHLLKEQGYDVTGVYLECWRAPGCRSEEDRKDALQVALSLELPFQVLDFKEAYRERVVENFFAEYAAGRTPNPDVMCNKEIKFGLFYDWAMKQGFDFVATGHYAQVDNEAGQLLAAADTHKDQTYFLYRLRPEQLTKILFPIGHLTKPQVRQEAKQRGLHVATKKDSVGICFIGDINVHNFLRERLGENPGEVVDVSGNVIGSHKGLWFYTVGQRHGFQVNATTSVKQSDGSSVSKHNLPPFYVIEKRPEHNQLVVGFGADTYKDRFGIQDAHWIDKVPTGQELLVRIRHTGELLESNINDQDQISLARPAKGIAEGQSAVFYRKSANKKMICVGGGVITAYPTYPAFE